MGGCSRSRAGAGLASGRAERLLAGAVLLTGLGVAATLLGVVVPALFLPGVVLVGVGLAACALAGLGCALAGDRSAGRSPEGLDARRPLR